MPVLALALLSLSLGYCALPTHMLLGKPCLGPATSKLNPFWLLQPRLPLSLQTLIPKCRGCSQTSMVLKLFHVIFQKQRPWLLPSSPPQHTEQGSEQAENCLRKQGCTMLPSLRQLPNINISLSSFTRLPVGGSQLFHKDQRHCSFSVNYLINTSFYIT